MGEATEGERNWTPASAGGRRGALGAIAALLVGGRLGRGEAAAGAEPSAAEVEAGVASGRYRRRKQTCTAAVGEEFLDCEARCRRRERLLTGGCRYAEPDGDGDIMTLVQSFPRRRTGWACQWTSDTGVGVSQPSTYRALAICRTRR